MEKLTVKDIEILLILCAQAEKAYSFGIENKDLLAGMFGDQFPKMLASKTEETEQIIRVRAKLLDLRDEKLIAELTPS